MRKSRVFAVILAGGQSTRLFPFNKVLSDLTGSGRTLIQQAYDRLGLPAHRVHVLTVQEMVAPIRKQLPIPNKNYFVDPVRRGTWPAILWAMAHLRQEDPSTVLAIVTGDHVIQGAAHFKTALRQAVRSVEQASVIGMLGIPPTGNAPEWQSFGCFRADSFGRVMRFEEKPTQERALEMMDEGGWAWNSGMFFFRISTAEIALQQYQPMMFRVYQDIVSLLERKKERQAKRRFEAFPDKITHPLDPKRRVDNSIDYAIMTPLVEKPAAALSAFAVTDIRFRWTDLGQWDALRKVMKADRRGNICLGNVSLQGDVSASVLLAEKGHRIEASGVREVVIAFAQGKALVLPLAELPRIKELVEKARARSKAIVTAGLGSLSLTLRGKRLVVSSK